MNYTVTRLGSPTRVTRALHLLATAAALLCAAPAMATPITFESFNTSGMVHGDTLSEAGYDMRLLGGPVPDAEGDEPGGVGAIVNNSDPESCFMTGCPAGATGNYYAAVNDGGIRFTRAGHQFMVGGLSLAFVSPGAVPDAHYGLLQLSGVRADGSSVFSTATFPGQDASGSFAFGPALLDQAFRNEVLTGLTVNACLFDGNGGCFNSLDNPAFGQAQFALDNISFNAVPEPGSFLLLGLGISVLGLSRRRPATPVTLS